MFAYGNRGKLRQQQIFASTAGDETKKGPVENREGDQEKNPGSRLSYLTAKLSSTTKRKNFSVKQWMEFKNA